MEAHWCDEQPELVEQTELELQVNLVNNPEAINNDSEINRACASRVEGNSDERDRFWFEKPRQGW